MHEIESKMIELYIFGLLWPNILSAICILFAWMQLINCEVQSNCSLYYDLLYMPSRPSSLLLSHTRVEAESTVGCKLTNSKLKKYLQRERAILSMTFFNSHFGLAHTKIWARMRGISSNCLLVFVCLACVVFCRWPKSSYFASISFDHFQSPTPATQLPSSFAVISVCSFSTVIIHGYCFSCIKRKHAHTHTFYIWLQ